MYMYTCIHVIHVPAIESGVHSKYLALFQVHETFGLVTLGIY